MFKAKKVYFALSNAYSSIVLFLGMEVSTMKRNRNQKLSNVGSISAGFSRFWSNTENRDRKLSNLGIKPCVLNYRKQLI